MSAIVSIRATKRVSTLLKPVLDTLRFFFVPVSSPSLKVAALLTFFLFFVVDVDAPPPLVLLGVADPSSSACKRLAISSSVSATAFLTGGFEDVDACSGRAGEEAAAAPPPPP